MFRILNVIDSLISSQGGPVRSVTQLSENLNKIDKFESSIICNDNQIHIKNIISNIFYFKNLNLFILKKFLFKFDLIHFHGIWTYNHLMLAFACVIFKKKFVIQPRGMLEPWSLNNKRYKKILSLFVYQRYLLKKAKYLIATSSLEFNNLKKLKVNNNIKIIPNGINVPKNDFRKKNLSNKKFVFLFLSRIDKKKGLEILIDSLSNLNKINDNWILNVVGPSEIYYKNKLKKKADILNISHKIFFFNEVDDLVKIDFYLNSDFFVLPSHSENFGLVIAESLSYKTPVITTIHTPWAEINKYDCGWCIDDNIESLTLTLKDAIMLNRKKINLLGENGYNYIQKFDWSVIIYQFIYHYKEALLNK